MTDDMIDHDTVYRAHSPSRGKSLFIGQSRAYVDGMTVHLNDAAPHMDGGVSDWQFQRGVVQWGVADASR